MVACAHLLTLVFLGHLISPQADQPISPMEGPSNSPVAWVSAKRDKQTTKGESIAQERAASLIGRQVGEGILVSFDDRFPFGLTPSNQAWVFAVENAVVMNGTEMETIKLSVAIDEPGGKLLAMFTEAKPSWVLPTMALRSPEDEARVAHWTVREDAVDRTTQTPEQVLSLIWSRYGISPSAPGQIVMRPRRVASRYPAVRGEDHSTPLFPEGVAWIVQVLGVYVPQSPTQYWTGYLILIDDKTGTIIQTLMMP